MVSTDYQRGIIVIQGWQPCESTIFSLPEIHQVIWEYVTMKEAYINTTHIHQYVRKIKTTEENREMQVKLK
jgi:hypothetical protein